MYTKQIFDHIFLKIGLRIYSKTDAPKILSGSKVLLLSFFLERRCIDIFYKNILS